MSVASFLLGRRPFAERSEIIEFVKNSENYDPEKDDLSKADALLIFQTSKQQTWLVSSSERLYCILDDLRKDKPHINWSMPKATIISAGKINLQIKTRDETVNSGLVDIGPTHTNWYFSKRLFSKVPIKKSIYDLIQKTMFDAR
jgi:hypothetical protein